MIISASRRTDIPAYYAEWLLQRLRERYALVRNPMNLRRVSRIDLSPEAVDGIVLWTKNPEPMLDKLSALRDYTYYFQFTLTAYGADVEGNLPPKLILADAFRALSDSIGIERVVWRYDPILINGHYTEDYHVRCFEQLASRLAGYTQTCIVSFIDIYPKIAVAARQMGITHILNEQKWRIAKRLSEIALAYGLDIQTCAETLDFSKLGIGHARCIDAERLSRIGKRAVVARKDRNQRPACGCAESVDIGAYNTCMNGCRYCYANTSISAASKNNAGYDPKSPLLCSNIDKADTVYERNAKKR